MRAIFARGAGKTEKAMNHRHGRSICFATALLTLAGCSEGPGEESVGKLGVNLGTTVNSIKYRLMNATFDVSGAQAATITTAADPNAMSVQTNLLPGNYFIDLQPNWILEKETAAGSGLFSAIPAQVVSPDPFGFAITAGQTTSVGYAFATDGGVVSTTGTLDLSISVNDTSNQAQVLQIAAGASHTCALLGTGSVRCWGSNSAGQLGYGNGNPAVAGTPAQNGDVPVGGAVTQIAAGSNHTCALLATGAVRCWGSAANGRLGYGNTNDIGDDEPASAAGDLPLGAVTAVATGGAHTCVMLAAGGVRCWGASNNGQTGSGQTSDLGDNESIGGVADVNVGTIPLVVATGSSHTCVRTAVGNLRCWGTGALGQLGYGNTNNIGDNETPNTAGNVSVDAQSLGAFDLGGNHTCALTALGGVRCWGSALDGQLGYGNTNNIGDGETPQSAGDVNVGGPSVAIALGQNHSCAISSTGALRCWGNNAFGQLGYGNVTNVGDNETPASAGNVNVGANVSQVTAGNNHTCAILAGGTAVRCWGRNDVGQLGYGTTTTIGDNEAPATAGDVPLFAAAPSTFALTVAVSAAGTAAGTVTSNPSGISCTANPPNDCSENYPAGAMVTLTASPASGSTFIGWSGACSGTTATTVVTMSQAQSCTAAFSSGGTTGSVTFVAAGTGVSSQGDLVVPYPAGVTSGQFLVLQLGFRQDTVVTVPPGWAQLFFDNHSSANPRQRLYYRFAAIPEPTMVSVVATTPANGVNMGRIYSFAGVRTSSPFEGESLVLDTDGSLSGPTVTSSGPRRLAVCFVAIDSNPPLSPFAGELGGDWIEPVAEATSDLGSNFGLQLQIANLPTTTGGTISGGSANFGGSSDASLGRAFALIAN
jgi:alpha-tubulin suppressor-like RCC1 family protein